MKKKFVKYALLFLLPLTLIGCGGKKEPSITNKEESTIIKNAKSVDEYLNKKDYKSIAYAFISHIKDETQSYESETNGTVKAKVAFIDYNIKYNTVTHKSGNKFYSKDISTSALMNVKNEFYMVDKEKILVSKDLKKYNVYTLDDYHKISYSPNQYVVMGYVFTDESITKTDLVSDKDDIISVKYTLDNELATNLVKIDMKSNGGLSSYPVFHNIEITLSMKRDFTPVSYSINSVYDATKPIIGTARTTQNGECLFSKVNEKIVIPNEEFLAEKLGAKPSEIIIDDEEQTVKDELIAAVKKLDFEHGVNVSGDLKLNLDLLSEEPLVLNIDTNVLFDMKRLSQDKIYEAFDFYAKVEGDEKLNSLISLVKSIAGEKLGEYADLLDNFKSLTVVYDEAGSLYLMPVNQSDVLFTMFKMKLTDIVDLVLQQVNLYNLVSGSNQDFATFTKIEGKDANNFEVEINLNEDINESIEEGINSFFENPDYALIKTVLGYQKFDSIKIKVGVVDGVVNTLDASFNYVKGSDGEVEDAALRTLLALHLVAVNKTFDFESEMHRAEELYSDFVSVQDLKARMVELNKNIYVSRGYLDNVKQALEEYQALNEQQKQFVGPQYVNYLETAQRDVTNILNFLNVFYKYDFAKLDNAKILELVKVYYASSLNTTLLKKEISEEDYQRMINIADLVDYSSFENAIDKMEGDDENSWGLSEQEIRDIKLLLDIAQYDSSVKNNIMLKAFMKGKYIDVDSLSTKINSLYNNLPNP